MKGSSMGTKCGTGFGCCRSNSGKISLQSSRGKSVDIKSERRFVFLRRADARRAFPGQGWFVSAGDYRILSDLDEAIRIEPREPSAYSVRGVFCAEHHWCDAARVDFDKAIALDPKNANSYVDRAVLFETQKDFK